MSMNLHVSASRVVTVVATGEESSQTISFDLWQTPTNVTNQLIHSSDVAQAYKDWVLSKRRVDKEPVYADDDLFEEGEIIGYEEVCVADEHIKDFDEFIDLCNKGAYVIEFYEL